MAVNSQENVKFEGAENIVNYASSEWAERGFCRKCGSNLYYHLLPRPEVPDGMYMLAAGTVVRNYEPQWVKDKAPEMQRYLNSVL